MTVKEPLKLHRQERCGECGDITRALDEYGVEYDATYAAPESPLIDAEAQNGWARDPVIVDDEKPSNSVVGHEAVLEWVEDTYSDD